VDDESRVRHIRRRLRRQRADYLAAAMLLPWCLIATVVAVGTLSDARFDAWRGFVLFADAFCAALWITRR